jgi:hypothetical protein
VKKKEKEREGAFESWKRKKKIQKERDGSSLRATKERRKTSK